MASSPAGSETHAAPCRRQNEQSHARGDVAAGSSVDVNDTRAPEQDVVKIELAILSRQGGRPYNEDACGHWHSERRLCCVVADGARSQLRDDTDLEKSVTPHTWGATW